METTVISRQTFSGVPLRQRAGEIAMATATVLGRFVRQTRAVGEWAAKRIGIGPAEQPAKKTPAKKTPAKKSVPKAAAKKAAAKKSASKAAAPVKGAADKKTTKQAKSTTRGKGATKRQPPKGSR
jgi:hypothetical protein